MGQIQVSLSGDLIQYAEGQVSTRGFRDVSQYVEQLIHADQATRAELARSNEELSQFAYSAAHDLQAPLRRTKAFCELLYKKYHDRFDGEAAEYLDFIIQSTSQMQDLVTGLLEYGRAGTCSRRFEPVDCSRAFDDAVANLQLQIEERDVQVTRDELPTVNGDRTQLVQLFQNLLNNAVKYCDQRTPVVHASAAVDGDFTRFSIRDNGIGIDAKYQDQVFAVFRRLHGDEKYSGSGIGLAICRKIVQRHGGRIWFDSKLGEGSTFHFTIAREKPT